MHKNKVFPYLLLLPFLVLFGLFKTLPIIYTFIESVVNIDDNGIFLVLFKNIDIMINDNLFWKSLTNTLIIFLIYIVIKFFLIFIVSNLLEDIKHNKLYLLILYLPNIIGLFAYAIIFRYIFTYHGVLNNVFDSLFGLRIDWLGNSWNSRVMLSIATLWGSLGFYTLLYFNSLRNIPKTYFEVFSINGGNSFQKLVFLQIPLTIPVIKTIIFMSLIEIIALIEIPMNLTMGGPNRSTITISYYVYIQAIEYANFSYAATLGLMIMLFGFLIFYIKKPKGEFLYEIN